MATVNVKFATKVATTFCAWLIVTVHVPVPGQFAPDHPANVELSPALALRVTAVPENSLTTHPADEPVEQLTPPPSTWPTPSPTMLTDRT
jgi:hypothetical protein